MVGQKRRSEALTGVQAFIYRSDPLPNSLFADFTAYSGAAVSVQRSSCVVRDSNFLRNSILGGGIGSAIAMTLPCEVDLYGCLFEYNNMAAVLFQNINYQHKVIRFIFRFNEGSNLLGESLGGAFNGRAASLYFADSVFDRNHGYPGITGGALSAETGSIIILENCTFLHNKANEGAVVCHGFCGQI